MIKMCIIIGNINIKHLNYFNGNNVSYLSNKIARSLNTSRVKNS